MTHDFARQRAARTSREKKGASPPWLWFTSGLVMGVLLSFLVYLATLAPAPARPTVASLANPPAAAKDGAKSKAPEAKPTFTYYTELAQITTERPARNDAPSSPEPAAPTTAKPAEATPPPTVAATAKAPPPSAKPPAPAVTPPVAKPAVEVPEPVALTLQAGAFRDASDASRRRADITLLGYPARVETIAGGGDGARYRVQVGPFKDSAALAGARGALKDQGIEVR